MIVSRATAVLPVWRSPMISSRWPRPMGTMPSMALRPVCSGSRTGWRSTTPGAMTSTGLNCVVATGPLPSMGWPSAFTTRPIMRVADGHGHDAAGALDLVAFLDLGVLAHEHDADRVLFEVQGDGHDAVGQLEQLARHAALEAVDAGDAVPHGEHGPGLGDVDAGGEAAQLLADDLGDLFGPNVHAPPLSSPSPPASAAATSAARAPSRRRSVLPSSPACRPRSRGSTRCCRSTSRPVAAPRALATARVCVSSSGVALTASAATTPRCAFHIFAYAAATIGSSSRRSRSPMRVTQAGEQLGGLGAAGHRGHQLPLALRGERGVGQERLQVGMSADHRHHVRELGAQRLRLPLLGGHVEEGARVAARRSGRARVKRSPSRGSARASRGGSASGSGPVLIPPVRRKP